MFRRTFMAIIAITFMFYAGCAFIPFISPILAIGVMWMEGEAHKYYHADQQTVLSAIKNAANEMEFVVVDQSVSGNTIYLKVDDQAVAKRTKGANRFNMKITAIQHNVTKLLIRINTWGDKPYAELMYRKVDNYPGVKSFRTVEELEKAHYGRK